ncbi:hypothetical protein [Massilia sp. ZL223]|uniref:hypothetical protein n=1 Tax=Massilia sp. ZL223 TaxID=2824904 RepID=UPI001B82E43E|nr:hypothetical protein [Massilia sp. ZL223]
MAPFDPTTALAGLTRSQLDWISAVTAQFKLAKTFWAKPGSDLITPSVLERIGDALRIHHAFSRQALSKDRFEYAFERALSQCGFNASLASSRTNRGHDLTINDVRVSLKTEASAAIKENFLHISKFMELGRGEWHLPTLRDLFLEHMQGYERILQFRCLKGSPEEYFYELVEIPMDMLREAANARLEVMENSKQNPKPGYGYVLDAVERQKFALYFDGGTERKLQIKSIRKELCTVHATWQFKSAPLG